MYIPNAFRNSNTEELVAFMQANSFATLVSIADGIPVASHIPLITAVSGETVTITGHLAKANTQWQAFAHGESLAMFSGPHAYVSPSFYEKHENVPTWNYIAVHAYGTPKPIKHGETPEAMAEMLRGMIATYEAAYQIQWDSLSTKYRDGMMNGIVGFEMVVTRLEGKYKLSQNRSATDQHTVAHALSHSDDPAAVATGLVMRQKLTE